MIFTVPWTMVHGFWGLTILSLLPGIGLVLGIILGIYGNELAWKKSSHQDHAIFIEQQRKWNQAGKIVAFVIAVIFGILILFLVYGLYFFKSNQQFHMTFNW